MCLLIEIYLPFLTCFTDDIYVFKLVPTGTTDSYFINLSLCDHIIVIKIFRRWQVVLMLCCHTCNHGYGWDRTHNLPYNLFRSLLLQQLSANIYMFKVNNGNTRKNYEVCSKLLIKILERRQRRWCRSC